MVELKIVKKGQVGLCPVRQKDGQNHLVWANTEVDLDCLILSLSDEECLTGGLMLPVIVLIDLLKKLGYVCYRKNKNKKLTRKK